MLNFRSVTVDVYLELSAKYASSAVTRLRRSDFICVRCALPFVLANFGIAIAARMPMITTTINSSIRVKPLRSLRVVEMGLGKKVELLVGGGLLFAPRKQYLGHGLRRSVSSLWTTAWPKTPDTAAVCN